MNATVKRRITPQATVKLPTLSGEKAEFLVDILDNISQAIWDAHGDAIAERICHRASSPESTPPDEDFESILDNEIPW
jgi:hypothetical protein